MAGKANVVGGAAIGAGVGAFSYALDRGIEYLQTGTFEWDWGEFGLSVGIGAAAGAAGGYLRWRSLQKPTVTLAKAGIGTKPIEPPGTNGKAGGSPSTWREAQDQVESLLRGTGSRTQQEVILRTGKLGARRVDVLAEGGLMPGLHEVKSGSTLLTMSTKLRIQVWKDVALRAIRGQDSYWHLMRPASQNVLNFLQDWGIKVITWI